MKRIIVFLTLAIALTTAVAANFSLSSSAVVSVFGDDDKDKSVMTITVKSIIGNEKDAESLKTSLTKVSGITDVNYCTTSGTVKIKYVKAKLGCCSKIHSALKDSSVNYEMVSNEEKPACSGSSKKDCQGKKACSKEKQS